MRILITGASGFIGSSLVRAMPESKYQLFLASRSSKKYIFQENINSYHQVNWSSKTEMDALCQNIDLIVHAAGINAIDAQNDPEDAEFFNGVVTSNLIDAAIKAQVKRFIYFSTAHVYRSPLEGTINESSAINNPHAYATSHITGEQAVINAANSSLIDGLVLRVSNVFGAPSIPNSNCWNLFVNNLCMQAIKDEKLRVTGNPLAFLREHQKIFKSKLDLLQSQDSKGRELEKLCYQSSLYDFFQIETNNSTIAEIQNLLHFCKQELIK
jgi:UDP-glucose 4-epimerase